MTVLRQDIENEIRDILDREDLSGNISRWFRRAHRAGQQRHNFLAMEISAFTGMVEEQDVFEIPADHKLTLMLYTYNPFEKAAIRFFERADIEFIRGQRYQGTFQETSFYAQWKNVFEIIPPIGAGEVPHQLRLDYYRYLDAPALDASDYFTDNGELYLIYRALRESAPFLGADTRIATWTKQEQDAWNDLYRVDMEARIAGTLIMRG